MTDANNRILQSLPHAISTPQTQRAVKAINKNLTRTGRQPATIKGCKHMKVELHKERTIQVGDSHLSIDDAYRLYLALHDALIDARRMCGIKSDKWTDERIGF